MVAGAFTGWLAVFQGADQDRGAGSGGDGRRAAGLGLVHASLTVWLGASQHVSGWGSRCWPPVLAAYAYRVSFPR